MIKCIVIDDEELARTLIETYIDKTDFLELSGSFENPLEAMPVLKQKEIGIVFLDIQMPELKGTEFAKLIPDSTSIIFTTAYSEYALEGFDLNAIDYLLKPIAFSRFIQAVNKFQTKSEPKQEEDFITIKSGYDLYKVKFNSIWYIKSDGEYVVFYTDSQKLMSYQSLKSLENMLPSTVFQRVHRSYIVNKNFLKALKGKDLLINDQVIPVSDSYYEVVRNLF